MSWVVFSCSFPSDSGSTPRVAVWRRLRRAGAVAPKAGLYVLPATDECVEAVQWLAQEARHANGDPVVMRVESFEGLADAEIVELFHEARRQDYEELVARAAELERDLAATAAAERGVAALHERLAKLRNDYQQVARIDYFHSPHGRQVAARLAALSGALAGPRQAEPEVPAALRSDYRGRRWVTRPRPFIDRVACAWLIRRFIDPAAEIRYATAPAADDVAFDMNEGEFQHLGNRCTFEVMVAAFGLDEPGLAAIAEIVHEIDLRDGRYTRPELAGVESVVAGWQDAGVPDREMEAAGARLFDGLFASLRRLEPPPAGGEGRGR